MNETLEQLIKLQEIDHRLLEIKEFMGDLPSTVKTQENDVKNLKSDNELKLKRINEIKKELRHYERETEGLNDKMAKFKDQLYLVKSNKEYDSLNSEIDHLKSNISDFETQFLNLSEEQDNLEEEIKLNNTKIDSISESLSSNTIELKLAIAETNTEQKDLENRRNNLFNNIESIKLNAYERIRQSREGTGMVSIIGNACGGCFSQLPPQTVIEIKKNLDIISCPGCSIMLFWDGAEE